MFMIYSKTKKYGPLNMDTALERLKRNASAHGFEYNGRFYFTSKWSPRAVHLLEEGGFVRRAGKPEDLRSAGITVPQDFAAYQNSTFYAVKLTLLSETVN